MKINQVEELVGITKKNIRFYEEQGLLNPERNPENGYREYSLKDVESLSKIKLLRKLDISIEEIKRLESDQISFKECLENQAEKLKKHQADTALIIELCNKMAGEVGSYDLIDAQRYLDELKQLEKGGVELMDITKEDVRKKSMTGAIVAAVFFILLMAALITIFTIAALSDPIPVPVFVLFMLFPIVAIVLTTAALFQRISEIKKGEAYEARKY